MIKRILCSVVITVAVAEGVFASDKVIAFSAIPMQAQQFFNAHFSVKKVVKVSMDSDYFFQKEYKLLLSDGTKVEFNSAGRWTKVSVKSGAVPVKIIPAQILHYLAKSFPGTFVTEVERSRNGYDVEISNGLDLEFDREGLFLRVDD